MLDKYYRKRDSNYKHEPLLGTLILLNKIFLNLVCSIKQIAPVLKHFCHLFSFSMPKGNLVNLRLRMASSPIWVVLCSLGPTLSSSFAAVRTSMATSSPARLQGSIFTSCVTLSPTIQSSDRADTWTGESFILLHQSRSVYVIL